VTELYQSFAEERKISIHAGLSGVCEAKVDRNRIRQIFANLLANAIQYTHEGGRMTSAIKDQVMRGFPVHLDGPDRWRCSPTTITLSSWNLIWAWKPK
jgi:hypothetical protein